MRFFTAATVAACLLLGVSTVEARPLRAATATAPVPALSFIADLQPAVDGMRWSAGQALHQLLVLQKSYRVSPELATLLLDALRTVPDLRVMAGVGRVRASVLEALRRRTEDVHYVGEMIDGIRAPRAQLRSLQFWLGVYLAHNDYFQKHLLDHPGAPATAGILRRAAHPDAHSSSCGPERHSCGEVAGSSGQ